MLAGAAAFGATVGMLGLAFSSTATVIAMLILAIGMPATLWAMSPVVRVCRGGGGPTGIELRCGRAHIDLGYLGHAEILSEQDLRDRIGIDSSGRDFICFSPWVKTAVAIDNVDETDPIATWVVCTRHPERFAQALKKRTPNK